MYPGFMHWRRQREQCGYGRVGLGWEAGERGYSRGGPWVHAAGEDEPGSFGGGAFGVRRPLRFLAYKLELTDAQVGELARVLDHLKTERAQAAVDQRRALAAFADAVAGEAFDRRKADEGASIRLASAEKLRNAVSEALSEIHGLLEAPQRARLAYLIRTGTLTL